MHYSWLQIAQIVTPTLIQIESAKNEEVINRMQKYYLLLKCQDCEMVIKYKIIGCDISKGSG
jgi:hypothetical protein